MQLSLLRRGRWITTFSVAVSGCFAISVLGIWAPELLQRISHGLTETVFRALDWFYMVSVTGFLVFSLFLAFSPIGRLRLGRAADRPEFSTTSWLAMLFSAGMGSGLLFWGVAEPMSHYAAPPLGEAQTAQAAREAMVLTNFHWGLHAWGVYTLAALVLAFFGFRHNQPYMPGAPIRRVFVGRWVEPVARASDFVAVLAVAFGVGGALGLGILQIQTGLHVAFGVPKESLVVSITILVLLTVAFMTSAATSINKGIKWLSTLNIVLAAALMLFVLFSGPTAFILRTFVTSVGDYASGVVSISLGLYPYEGISPWVESWTLTYFIWWIAWAPFVGVFVARISRGRTIREFVFGTLLAPTAFSALWFGVFGGTAFHQEIYGQLRISRLVQEDVTLALFSVFDSLPLSLALTVMSIFLICVFVITSADSATFVLSMLTSQGSMDPPRQRKLTWGIVLGAMSGALLVARDTETIRAVAISGAIPFTLVLLLQVGAFVRQLLDERSSEHSASDGHKDEPIGGGAL